MRERARRIVISRASGRSVPAAVAFRALIVGLEPGDDDDVPSREQEVPTGEISARVLVELGALEERLAALRRSLEERSEPGR